MQINPESEYQVEITVGLDECVINLHGYAVSNFLDSLLDHERVWVWLDVSGQKLGLDTTKIARICVQEVP